MYKQEPFSRRGSLKSLRSAPLLSTVLESTLSLSRIHPIASLELPGLDYIHAVQSQSALPQQHSELGTSICSSFAAITSATTGPQPQATLKTRQGIKNSLRENKRNKALQRPLSRKLKPHLVADTVKQYISRAQRRTKESEEQQPNMEFLRGVYAFMQVSRSSADYQHKGYETETTSQAHVQENQTLEKIPMQPATTSSNTTSSNFVKAARNFNDRENEALQEELKQRFAKNKIFRTIKDKKDQEMKPRPEQQLKQSYQIEYNPSQE